jgi:TolA-binding protein
MAQLSRVDPPPYAPSRLRGVGERAAFEAAMARYVAGDLEGAVTGLRPVVRADPSAEDARFYLGASELLTGHAADAIATLLPVANRGDSAYAEEASFLIAKAQLGQGDAASARRALDRTITFDGSRATEARELRRRLDAAVERPR